ANVEQVADAVVEADGKFFIVRLSGRTPGHRRTLQEADRSIRVAILQNRMQELEKKLDSDLRAKFPVEIDDKALGEIKLPAPFVDAAPAPSPFATMGPQAAPNPGLLQSPGLKKQDEPPAGDADAGTPDASNPKDGSR